MANKNWQLQPVITEKSYALANALNKYTFLVPRGVNKIEIAREVEKEYKVKVEGVNMTVRPGKLARDWKTRRYYRKEDMRKAVVQLKKGDKIDEFLNIA
jgi:large subunit ribosomal protein L23